jgi:hypothetical protein
VTGEIPHCVPARTRPVDAPLGLAGRAFEQVADCYPWPQSDKHDLNEEPCAANLVASAQFQKGVRIAKIAGVVNQKN